MLGLLSKIFSGILFNMKLWYGGTLWYLFLASDASSMKTAVDRLLINFIHDRSQQAWRGYVYAVLMFIVAFIQSMLLHQYFHRCMVVGMRIRTALIAAVYKKVRCGHLDLYEYMVELIGGLQSSFTVSIS